LNEKHIPSTEDYYRRIDEIIRRNGPFSDGELISCIEVLENLIEFFKVHKDILIMQELMEKQEILIDMWDSRNTNVCNIKNN
jgi:hypothetical protein